MLKSNFLFSFLVGIVEAIQNFRKLRFWKRVYRIRRIESTGGLQGVFVHEQPFL